MTNSSKSHQANLLIVDDQPSNLNILSRILSNQGYRVRAAINGELALKAIDKQPPDLILLDVLMPDMSGHEVCRQLKKDPQTQNIPIIFVSAMGDVQNIVKSFNSGAVDYITRPFREEEVLAKVENHISLQVMQAQLSQKNRQLEQEIAKHNRTEAALRRSKQQYQMLFETMLDGYALHELIFDEQGNPVDYRFLEINPAFEELTGLSRDIIGKTVREVLPETEQYWIETYGQVVESGEPIRFESFSAPLDQKWFEVVAFCPTENQFATIFQDITARKQAEDELRKLTQAVEQSASPIVITDTDGIIEFVNPAFTQITGYSAQEAIGQNPRILQSGHHSLDFYKNLWRTISAGNVWHGDMLNRTKDGRLYWESATISPIKDTNGQITHYVAINEDITERKSLERVLEVERASLAQRVDEQTASLQKINAQLSQSVRIKDEFLANMSHELRTPLNAILGMAEILKDQVYGPVNEAQLNSLKIMKESGQHLLDLINDILDLSKIEAGKLELSISSITLAEACQASLRFVQRMAQKKRIDLQLALDGSLETMQGDERRLKQILVNLLSNAVKFTDPQGKVGLNIQSNPVNNAVDFIVWDTGVGISDENMALLFEPFMQIDNRLNRQHDGTGLGLSLVYRLADMHGGSVSVTSRKGEGSRFTVSLPLEQGFSPPAQPVPAASFTNHPLDSDEGSRPADSESLPTTEPPLLLLAEDSQANINTLKAYFEYSGYRIVVAKNGAQAVEQATNHLPDVILMDIQMPVMSGLEAIQQIRTYAELLDVPIIALTALSMPNDQKRCLAAGANIYLSKPVSLSRLAGIIQQAISSQ